MAYTEIKSADQFKSEVVESDKPVIVDFWAPWCGPCKMMGPIFEAVSNEVDTVKFAKLDIDDEAVEEVASKFNIMAVPTLVIVKGGQVAATKSGALTKDQLKAFIDDNV